MEQQKRIIEAITSAINNLETSIKAVVNRNENEVEGSVWQAAADLEYATFLFSIAREHKSSSWKLKLRSKQVEIGPLLVSAQDLLKDAKSCFDSELCEAHKKTGMARGYLLKAQEILEKRRKKGRKSTLSP